MQHSRASVVINGVVTNVVTSVVGGGVVGGGVVVVVASVRLRINRVEQYMWQCSTIDSNLNY